jgi:RNA polymerase-interacting CarD/CdnL/TRCF family regulator
MKTNHETVEILIRNSTLSIEDQNALINLFKKASEEDLQSVVKASEENPETITLLSENYKTKKKALASGDDIEWAKVIRSEEAILRKLQEN